MDNEFVRNHYNKTVKNINYEAERWYKDEASKEQYSETEKSILFHLGDESYKDVLEIGCGPGTWSRLLIEKSKKVFLVDISKEMLNQAKKRLGEKVKYICSDFLKFKTKKKFDLIFSCRAIEYMSDLDRVVNKFYKLLKKNSKIIVVTKNPARRWKAILFKKEVEEIHKNWSSIKKMKKIMKSTNFNKVEIYPAVFSASPFPNFLFVRRINSFLHSLLYKKKVSNSIVPFLESYVVVAYKTL